MLDVNLRAPFRLMRAAVPLLTMSRGAIVNVSSVTGTRSFPGVLAVLREQSRSRSADAMRGAGAGRRTAFA